MNKYQEALNNLKNMGDKDLYNERHLEWADTLQELVDKATPKKPEQRSQIWNIFMCPNCHCAVDGTYQKYCEECGQMLGSVEDE